MLIPKFHGKAINGELVPHNPEQRRAYLLGLDGKDIDEEIGPPRDSKTLQQLRYVHGVVFRLASEASGYTKIEVKGLLKEIYLKRHVVSKKSGKEISYTPSLEDLKKDEMSEFIEECKLLCAKEWHCVIPDPPDVGGY